MKSKLLERNRELEEKNRALTEENKSLQKTNKLLETKNESLKQRVQTLLARIFGRRSERFGENPDQLTLFSDELFTEAKKELEAELEKEDDVEEEPKRRRLNGRRPLPKDLPRERVEYHPELHERVCACCGEPMKRFGEDVTEELDYKPAKAFVREHVRVKYACPKCEEGVVSGALPPRPIEKGRPGPGLLAYIAVSKYAYHLPLYRLEEIIGRFGVAVTRSTMSDWVGWIALLLQPIVKELKRQILQSALIQSDDTPTNYRVGPKGPTLKGYLWSYGVPWGEVVYEFTTTRCRDGPTNFLKDYRGYLQSDGYEGYAETFRSGRVLHVACMAHIRRRFYDSREEAPEETKVVLAAIQKLYRIERHAKTEGLDGAARVELRREKSLPILEALGELLEEYKREALPESNLGGAIKYALDQWESMLRYVEVGEAEIDNNSAEHTMRPVVLGRKNYLHFGSPAGGQRAATIYSLIATCKRVGVDPYYYLSDVLERVSTHPQSRIGELTPRAWKEALSGAENSPQQTAR
jgi:transposase